MKDLLDKISTLTFGTEIECEGIARHNAARDVAAAFNANGIGGEITSYDGYPAVKDGKGRTWQFKYDGSLAGNGGCEMVTPILRWADIETLQIAIRALRAAGAKVNARCGMHVHVGTQGWSPRQIANLARIFYRQERIIIAAAGTRQSRLDHYTRPTDPEFIARLDRIRVMTLDTLSMAWFGCISPITANVHHYEPHRYRTLNLNNLWRDSKTVEFRLFESTLHAGEAKANIALCLALAAKALAAKAPRGGHRALDAHDGKFDGRALLVHLGLNGAEFATVRQHLTKRLKGSAYKHEWLARHAALSIA